VGKLVSEARRDPGPEPDRVRGSAEEKAANVVDEEGVGVWFVVAAAVDVAATSPCPEAPADPDRVRVDIGKGKWRADEGVVVVDEEK